MIIQEILELLVLARAEPMQKLSILLLTVIISQLLYLKQTEARIGDVTELNGQASVTRNKKEQEIKALSRPGILVAYEPNLADQELKIESSRAAIAQRLGVPLDAVDIASEDIAGELIIRSATIYLSARDVARIVDSR